MQSTPPEPNRAFAVWLTGRPASGKSTVTAALLRRLRDDHKVDAAHLESDALRKILTPNATYSDAERDWFYGVMLHFGEQFIRHGVPVVFDATANRRAYRDRARERIDRFIEVYVDTPLDVCRSRDPKGIYRDAGGSASDHVPGVQSPYEEPERAEVVVRGDADSPDAAAARIMNALRERGLIAASNAS